MMMQEIDLPVTWQEFLALKASTEMSAQCVFMQNIQKKDDAALFLFLLLHLSFIKQKLYLQVLPLGYFSRYFELPVIKSGFHPILLSIYMCIQIYIHYYYSHYEKVISAPSLSFYLHTHTMLL